MTAENKKCYLLNTRDMASERILDKTMEFNKFLTYKYILLKITHYTFMNLSEKKNLCLYRAELAEKDNQSWIYVSVASDAN